MISPDKELVRGISFTLPKGEGVTAKP